MSPDSLTPAQKSLRRLQRFSKVNGWSVVIVAGLGTLIELALGGWFGVGLGVLIAGAGWLEVRGNQKLQRRDPDGMKLLIRSQLALLGILLTYSIGRLFSFDAETVLAELTPDMESALREAGITRAEIVPLVHAAFRALYAGVAIVTTIYQGGLALYYRAKTPVVTEALQESARPAPPVLPPMPPPLS